MNYLFLDVETTGPALNMSAPLSDNKSWPYVVQLACILTNEEREVIFQSKYLVKIPDSVAINKEAYAIHGISEQTCKTYGLSPALAFTLFDRMLERADIVVCHNVKFDCNVMRAEYYRHKMDDIFKQKKRFCTMVDENVKKYVDAKNSKGALKWPNLQELHYKCFSYNFDNAHDAFADIFATMRSFWHLVDNGVINTNLL